MKNPHQIDIERQRHDRAAKGPKFTFKCALCGECRKVVGRRMVEGAWWCSHCVAGGE